MTPIDLRPPVCPHATAATGGNRRSRLSGEVSKAVFPIGFELSSRQNCPIPDGCGSFVVGEEPNKKKVWTVSTLFASDRVVQRPVWAGLLMFSRVPSVCRGWNAVRVPPRAQCFRRSEPYWTLCSLGSAREPAVLECVDHSINQRGCPVWAGRGSCEAR
jgi:hypothetical protein